MNNRNMYFSSLGRLIHVLQINHVTHHNSYPTHNFMIPLPGSHFVTSVTQGRIKVVNSTFHPATVDPRGTHRNHGNRTIMALLHFSTMGNPNPTFSNFSTRRYIPLSHRTEFTPTTFGSYLHCHRKHRSPTFLRVHHNGYTRPLSRFLLFLYRIWGLHCN